MMEGLLGNLGEFIKSPEGQGLLSAAFTGAASAQRGTPWNNFGRAGVGGLLGYQNAQENQHQQELRGVQMKEMRDKMEMQERMREAAKASQRTPAQMSLMNAQGPTVANAEAIPNMQPGFDKQGYVDRLWGIDPQTALTFEQGMAKDNPYGKVDPKDYTPESVQRFSQTRNYGDLQPVRKLDVVNNQAVDLYSTPAGTTFDDRDPNKAFWSVGGQPVPNVPFQNYSLNKAEKGATRVSVNTEKSLLNNIAGGLGGSLVDARGAAQAAAGTVNTLSRLNDALNSGKVIAGPGANFKQYGLQLGNMLGINGKDENDKLLNTRQAIQSLAQLELDAAQQMKGQGAITENERAIIRRAAAGEIDQMTSDELRVLVGVLDRTARYKIQTYQDQVKPLLSNPGASSISPFLNIEMPPALSGPAPQGAGNAGIQFLGFE